jgi:hypothetical protein
MKQVFEIWDTETGNLVGMYETEAAVLAVVRDAIDAWGMREAEALALGVGDGDERMSSVTAGPKLLARALATAPAR